MLPIPQNTSVSSATSLNVLPSACPKETCRALGTIYERRGTINEQMALVQALLDAGFDINQVIDVNGREMRVLDLAIEHGDPVFAESLVKECRANPHLCIHQDAWFMNGLIHIYDHFEPENVADMLDAAVASFPVMTVHNAALANVVENNVVMALPTSAGEVTPEQSLGLGHSIVVACIWSLYFSIGMAAISAAGGGVASAILKNYDLHYDLFEAAQMAGTGGAITGAVLGMVGPSVINAEMNGRESDFFESNTVFVSTVVAGALNGLIGYEIVRYGNTETSMDVAQAVAASFLGTLALAIILRNFL